MRRQQLTETQIASLFDPPTEPRELVRHYTLTETDLAIVRRCRGDHSRLGCALMLCYLRHPGRPLRANERPPSACAVTRRRFPVGARPTRRIAPAGSNRSSHGGNEMAEAFD